MVIGDVIITFHIKTIVRFIRAKRFLKTKAQEYLIHADSEKKDIDIVTIAFNNDMVIKYQIELLEKYLNDNYYYTVIDNSTDNFVSEKVKRICIEKHAGYIKLAENKNIASFSHGAALNWAYYNFILKRKLKYFGFIDHDIFPIKETSLIEKLEKSPNCCYGSIQEKKKRWYLWPGFCFYRFADVYQKKLNFMPGEGLDTGGMNWFFLYKNIVKESLLKVRHEYKNITKGNVKQINIYEILDESWIHSINASNWFGAGKEEIGNKEIELEKLLKSFLNKP